MKQKDFFDPEETHLLSGGDPNKQVCHLYENKLKNGKKVYELIMGNPHLICFFSKVERVLISETNYLEDKTGQFNDSSILIFSLSKKGLDTPVVILHEQKVPDFIISTLVNLEELK